MSLKLKNLSKLLVDNLERLFPQLQLKQFQYNDNNPRAKINIEGNTYLFQIIFCVYPYPTTLRPILNRVKKEKGHFLVVGSYFPDSAQQLLVDSAVNFLDLSGNCFLKIRSRRGNFENTIHLRVTGKSNKYSESVSLKNYFRGKSSRIIRTLLECYPKTWKPLELAKECMVSPPLITKVTNGMEKAGYVRRDADKGIVLLEPALLLDKWADFYKIKDNNVLIVKSFVTKSIDKILDNFKSSNDFVVTGMAGASLLAPHSDFDSVDVYVYPDKAFFFEGTEVEGTEVERGENVRIWAPYDKGVLDYSKVVNGIKVVGKIQLYLDLFSYPKRGKEQAVFFREQYFDF